MMPRNAFIFVYISYAIIIKNVISVKYSSTVKSNRTTIPNDIPSDVTSVTISSKCFIIAKGIARTALIALIVVHSVYKGN